jgi:regulator of sirC expression with transglutaminase-like and TPR domain
VTAAPGAFAALMARDESAIDLARACLLIAQDAYPGLDVEGYLGEIERLAARLRGRLPAAEDAEARIAALNEFLFAELGYSGNADHYYDPRNSYLNEVLDRRTGIPLTLSVLYMELGRRAGLALEGVSFPGHFLVRLQLPGALLVLDPFAEGEPQSAAELRARLRRVIPQGATGPVPLEELPLEQFLEPAGKRQILARLLRNLKGIYRESNQPERLLCVLNRMLEVSPKAYGELRDRGLLYQQMECHRAALKDLSDYAARDPDAPDVEEVRARVMALSALCARLN